MKKVKTSKQTLQLYWSFVSRYKLLVALLLLLTPLSIFVFRFLPPLFVARILEAISSGSFIAEDLVGSFGPDLLSYMLFSVLGGIVLWRITIFVLWQLEMRVIQDIHNKIFRHLLQLDANFHANRFSGSLVSQTNKFAGGYVRLQDSLIFQCIGVIVSILFSIILLVGRAPLLAVFLASYSLIFAVFVTKFTARIRKLNVEEARAVSKQTGQLADALTNVMAIKSFSAEDAEKKRYFTATQHVREIIRRTMWESMRKDTAISSFTTFLNIMTLTIAAASVVYFDADISTVYLAVTYIGIVNQNLWDFSQVTIRNINRALGDAQEMTEIMQIQPSVKDPVEPEPVRIQRGLIEFNDVTFGHDGTPEQDALFKHLSIRIKPGEKIGLVGHSGSGKTTLTKLLLRFTDIQSGSIKIDGQDIRHMLQNDLREKISYVPQEPLLFHRSIRENIAYGKPGSSDKEIEAIAKLAHAHEFVSLLENGYDTLVGERGVKLSGGQRQRIAIARAMLKNAPILVLDEATSALDSESEVLIQDALWKLMEGRTAIVIAHRLSTIQKMDRIIVLAHGKIREEGSHQELIRQQGTYAELWSHQSGGFLED